MLAVIGEPDQMFECLNEAVELKRPNIQVKLWAAFNPYRDAPRFIALLRRMNLEE